MEPIVAVTARRDQRSAALRRAAAAALIVAVTFLLRRGATGDWLYGGDEQFYLLAGERVLHGALPYVDLWDRKPAGLFLLFAGLSAIGGDADLVAATAASLCVAATAGVIATLVRPGTTRAGAMMGALFYVAIVGQLGGKQWQTPIFYNLLVVGAVWLALRTRRALASTQDRRSALAAMLLLGLAVQLKPTVVVEAVAIGGWLAWRLLQRCPPTVAAGRIAALLATAALPTVIAGTVFWLAGHGGDWWFATIVSQTRKSGGWDAESLERLRLMAMNGWPLVLLALTGLAQSRRDQRLALLVAWFAATLVEAVALGNFWLHYLLPAAAAGSVLAARAFALPRIGWVLFALCSVGAVQRDLRDDAAERDDARRAVAAVMAHIPRDAPRTCLLAYGVSPVFYRLTDACLVTRFPFPDHLASAAEAAALPIAATRALAEALARRPGTILTLDRPRSVGANPATAALLADALRRDYRVLATLPYRGVASGDERLTIWRRRELERMDVPLLQSSSARGRWQPRTTFVADGGGGTRRPWLGSPPPPSPRTMSGAPPPPGGGGFHIRRTYCQPGVDRCG